VLFWQHNKLFGQTLPFFVPAPFYDIPAVFTGHPGTKTVDFFSFSFFWLKSSFWHNKLMNDYILTMLFYK